MPAPGNFIDNAVVFGINTDEKAPPKRKILRQVLTLTGSPIEQDFSPMTNRHEFGDIRAIIIDWSLGTSQLVITSVASPAIKVAAGYQGIIPIPMCADNTLTFNGTGTLDFALTNTDTKVGVWNTSGGSSSGFGNNSDGVAPQGTGLQANISFGYAYDPTALVWDRMVLNSLSSVTLIPSAGTTNSLLTTGMMYARATGGIVCVFASASTADALPGNSAVLQTISENYLFNGASYDRARSNIDSASLIPLAAVAAGTYNSADQTNFNGKGVNLIVDITAIASGNLTLNIFGKDIASGKYYLILSSAALAAVATTMMSLYPGIATVANISLSGILPRTWRAQAVTTGTSTTATVGASVIL